MINEDLSLTDKFKLLLDLGFHGVELNTPVDMPIDEILEAKENGNRTARSRQQRPLEVSSQTPIRRCGNSASSRSRVTPGGKALGGDTVLVVPGVVNEKVSYEQAHITLSSRSGIDPYAEETGIRVGLETCGTTSSSVRGGKAPVDG